MTVSTLPVAVAGDDGDLEYSHSSWPANGGTFINTAAYANGVVAAKSLYLGTYYNAVALLRFNTGAIPDDATITGVVLKLYIESKLDSADNYGLVGDYYDFGGEPTVAGDWIETATSIFTAIDIGSLTATAQNNITLTNLSGINKTGYTGIRLTLTGGTPTTLNSVRVGKHESSQPAVLEVTYTGGTGPTTVNIPIAVLTDDGYGWRQDNVYATAAGGGGTYVNSPNETVLTPSKSYFAPTYYLQVPLLRFDTSGIPVGATIESAKLQLYMTSKSITNIGYKMLVEYFAFDGEPTISSDWVLTAGSPCAAAIDPASVTAGVVLEIPLTVLTGINPGGYTGFRFTMDAGGAIPPTGGNYLQFAAYDNTTYQEPRLEVVYTVTSLDSVLPDADVVTTGWTTAPLFSKINDASDSTVIQATAV